MDSIRKVNFRYDGVSGVQKRNTTLNFNENRKFK